MRSILRLAAAALLLGLVGAAALGAPATPFQPTARNDPNSDLCKKFWKTIGLPTYKKKAAGRFIVCRDRYMLSYNAGSRTPDWVLQHLKRSEITNQFERPPEKFSADDNVPKNLQPISNDYEHMPHNFEIGHMAPSEDYNNDQDSMRDTFKFTNAVPQVGDRFNASIWKRLELEARSAAVERGEVFVLTGPVRAPPGRRSFVLKKVLNKCGIENKLDGPTEHHVCADGNTRELSTRHGCDTGTEVPIAIFKIVFDPDQGTAHAFLMANKEYPTGLGDQTRPFLDTQRVHVGAIERLAGVNLFRGVAESKRTKLRMQCEKALFWARELLKN